MEINQELTSWSKWGALRGGDVRSTWDFCVERFIKKFVYFIYLNPYITNDGFYNDVTVYFIGKDNYAFTK